MAPPWGGAEINFYIWCAVGAAVGWLAGTMMGSKGTILRVEEMFVGIFGAFIGGEFVATLLTSAKAAEKFSAASLGIAIAGAAVLLILLRLMRKVVGPLRSHKAPPTRRH
jgi:uncharacterized membrane protein YeaQ/YmgE (transglycosylase-associated protein family)